MAQVHRMTVQLFIDMNLMIEVVLLCVQSRVLKLERVAKLVFLPVYRRYRAGLSHCCPLPPHCASYHRAYRLTVHGHVLTVEQVKTPKPSTYRRTHLFGYLISVLLANSLQSVGTVMSLKWILRNEVAEGTFCSAQGE